MLLHKTCWRGVSCGDLSTASEYTYFFPSLRGLNISFATLQQVRRVQNLVDTLDSLKLRNSNPFSIRGNAVPETTNWGTLDSGMGSMNAPPPASSSSTNVTQDSEQFD